MAAASISPLDDVLTPPPPIDLDSADTELPGYSVRSQADFVQQEHQLEDSKGRPWIWLRVKSRGKEGKALPLFYDRDTIAGEVEVDFDKAGPAKTVIISVSTLLPNMGLDIGRPWRFLWCVGSRFAFVPRRRSPSELPPTGLAHRMLEVHQPLVEDKRSLSEIRYSPTDMLTCRNTASSSIRLQC